MIAQFLKLNVSTLLVLPLLEGVQGKLRYQKSITTQVPLLQLAFESGLEKTYLYNKMSKEDNCIHCLFNHNVTRPLKFTTKPWASLNEILLSSPNFRDFRMHNDLILYSLEIPKEYLDILDLIQDSKYSALPESFKEALYPKAKEYVPLRSDMGNFLTGRNIPKKIVNKDDRLIQEICQFLQIQNAPEGFKKFDPLEETINYL